MGFTSLDLSQIRTDVLSSASSFRSLIALGTLATQSPTGTPSASTFLRGDYSWQTIDLSGYVPYTGANANLNLGSYTLTAKSATLSTGTITASTPAVDVTQTWNNAGVTFTGILANVTDTASNASSLLMDLQVGSVSKFKVDKAGYTTVAVLNTGSGSSLNCGGNISANGVISWGNGYASLSGGSGSTATVLYQNATVTGPIIFQPATGSSLVEQRNSTTAQTFRIYNTYTDASNYERLAFYHNSFGAVVGREAAGSGSASYDLNLSSTQNINCFGNSFTPLRIFSGTFASYSFASAFNCPQLGDINIGFQVDMTGTSTYRARGSGSNANPTIIRSNSGNLIFYADSSKTDLGTYTPTERFRITSTGLVAFGGSTSSFPAIKRNGTAINFRLADDSADAPITASQATLSTGTITASTPALDISQTWNNSGVAFTAAKINVTNTASINNSSLLDLQVSGVSKFNASLRGDVAFTGALSAGATANFLIPCDHAIASRTTGSGANSDSILDVASNTGHTGRLQSWTRAGTIVASIGTTGSASFNGYAYVYNTADSALNNYERGKLEWSSNVFRIGTEKAGTGSARALELQTDGTTRLTIGTDGSASFSGTISATSNMVLDPAGTATLRSMTFGLISLSGFARGAINGASTKTYFGSSVAQDVVLGANARQDLTINGTTGAATLSATLDLTIRTVTYGATMAIDAALGNKIAITLAGNGTISNPTNAVDGRVLVFRLRQDATGSRIPVWDTKYTFVGDLATVTLSTAANAIDRVAFEYDSTNDKWYCISFIKGS